MRGAAKLVHRSSNYRVFEGTVITTKTAYRQAFDCQVTGWKVRITGIVVEPIADAMSSVEREHTSCSGMPTCRQTVGVGSCPYRSAATVEAEARYT